MPDARTAWAARLTKVLLGLAGLPGGIGTATSHTRTGRLGGFGFGLHLVLGQALELRVDPDV